MKRFISLLLSLLIAFSAFPVAAEAPGIGVTLPEMTSGEFSNTAVNDTALKALFQFNRDLPRYDWGPKAPAPAKLTGVTYTLADNVVKVNSEITGNIRSVQQVENPNTRAVGNINSIVEQGGLIKADQLKAAAGLPLIKPGSVFVDLENNLAFKVPALPSGEGDKFQGYMPVVRPEIQEIIKDFNIPEQTVRLNQGNVTHFVEDADGNSLDKYLKKPGQTQVMSNSTTMEPIKPTHLKNIIAEFSFPAGGVNLNGVTPSGRPVKVNVKGYLAIGDMDLDGYYKKWKYAFWFSVAEEMQLQATVAMDMNEEVRIPILGVDIGFDSDIGSIAGGLFLVVGVDGKFTLEIEARQWVKLDKVGLKGKCAYYVPYTIGPLLKVGDNGFDLDSHFSGAVSGYVKAGALLELSLLGLDIVGAGVFAGMGARAAVLDEYIEADLYGIVQAYVKFIGKQKNIINWQPNILHKRQKNTAGYILTFKEVCGYRDEVWGTLKYDGGARGIVPEPDKDITIIVRKSNNNLIGVAANEKSYLTKTDENGNFHKSGVILHKGDEVYIRLKGRNSNQYVNSASVTPTFPFDKVIVMEADFFNDYVKGYVPPVVVKDWAAEGQKEIVFELNKSSNSSMKVNGKTVTLDSHGFFNLTGTNVLPSDKVSAELKFDGWVVNSNTVVPTVDFGAQSIRIPVSYEKTAENGKPADVAKLNETIIVTNNRGTKVYTGDAAFTVSGYTQAATACYLINPKTGLPIIQAMGIGAQTQPVKLYAIQEAEADELGSSYFTNGITKKWIWEPEPKPGRAPLSLARPGAQIKPPAVIPPPIVTVPKETDTAQANSGINSIRPIDPDFNKLMPGLPQKSFTLSYDDAFDKYSDYEYYNDIIGKMDNYSRQVDGTKALKWDSRIVITYEGAQIIMEVKDERRGGGDSKFETLSSEWMGKDVAGMLNRYMEKMGGSLVFPMPDEMIKSGGISNIK